MRNVGLNSKVLFTQFVGRAVRKLHPGDSVTAEVISHVCHNQLQNYENFEKIAQVDPEDEE